MRSGRPPSMVVDPGRWLPSRGLSFLLYKVGRVIFPILEGYSEDDMRESGSRQVGGAQTMSLRVMSSSLLLPGLQDVGPYHRRPFLLGQQRDCHCLPDIPEAPGSAQTIGPLFSRLQAPPPPLPHPTPYPPILPPPLSTRGALQEKALPNFRA